MAQHKGMEPHATNIQAPYMPEGGVDVGKWWKYKNLRTLNFLLLLPLISIFSQG